MLLGGVVERQSATTVIKRSANTKTMIFFVLLLALVAAQQSRPFFTFSVVPRVTPLEPGVAADVTRWCACDGRREVMPRVRFDLPRCFSASELS